MPLLISPYIYTICHLRIPGHRGHSFRSIVGTDSGTIVGSDSGTIVGSDSG
jgi:hypothetical protein